MVSPPYPESNTPIGTIVLTNLTQFNPNRVQNPVRVEVSG